ncbi:hypothetical protein BDZ89DRAFT_1202068 [Hymenopellis radicata]|nr:hypothetical protein BDZ89DRAFT_1202068 [Hymenopellis radicata]
MTDRDLNESYSGMTRDPASGYSRSKARTRDPSYTRLALTRESNESSTRGSGKYSQVIRITNESRILARHLAYTHLPHSPFMPGEHPRAIARGHSAMHDTGTEGGGGGGGDVVEKVVSSTAAAGPAYSQSPYPHHRLPDIRQSSRGDNCRSRPVVEGGGGGRRQNEPSDRTLTRTLGSQPDQPDRRNS